MRKVFIMISLVLLTLPFFVSNVSAHPGRTDSNGGHTCRTNCAKWGLQTGEYHYHNGGGSSSGSSSNSSTKSTTPAPPPKPAYSQADVNEGKSVGKSNGYEDGYNRNASNSVTDTGNEGFKKGYAAGYSAGYAEGLKKIKEEDRVAGTGAGEEDGKSALRKGESREAPINDSKSADWNDAYKAAFIKSYNGEKAVQDAENLGYDLGYSLEELVVPKEYATNEKTKQTFEAYYKTGYEKRIKEENEKHLELGSKDGYALSVLAIDSINEKFLEAYEQGYENGKSERKEEVLAEGYQSAFVNMKYQETEEYNNPEILEWYKEGFDSNDIATQIKDMAFDNGYTNSKYTIPEEFKVNDESIALYEALFEEGQELRNQEKQKKMLVTTGVGIPAVGAAIGGFVWGKRRKKKVI